MVRSVWPRLRSRAAAAAVPGFVANRDPGHEAKVPDEFDINSMEIMEQSFEILTFINQSI